MRQLNLQITDELRNAIRKRAFDLDIPISHVVRQALKKELSLLL